MVDSNYNCCRCSRSRRATCCFYFTLYIVERIANYIQSLESSDLGVMYKVERKQLDFQTAIVSGDKVRNNLLWLVKRADLMWDSLKGGVDQEHQDNFWDVPFPNSAVVAVSHKTGTAPQALTLHLEMCAICNRDATCGASNITRGGPGGTRDSRSSAINWSFRSWTVLRNGREVLF